MDVDTTLYYETDEDRIDRCKGCEHAVIAPLLEAGESPDTLYCKLMGYPCDMIIKCDLGE